MGNPCFKSKNAKFFLYFDLVKIMLNNFVEKKETFFQYKNKIFKSLKKWHFSKNATFFFYLDLVKIRREIMRNNFVEKKETSFGIKTKMF